MMNLKPDTKTMASRSPFESKATNERGCELHLRGQQQNQPQDNDTPQAS